MNGVFDRVREFHTLSGGRSASGRNAGCFQAGCWRAKAIGLDRIARSGSSYLEVELSKYGIRNGRVSIKIKQVAGLMETTA